ncbi:MAG: SCO family protein [Betaproteobacteria bacterium]
MMLPALSRRQALLLAAGLACLPAASAAALPGDSLYRLNPRLTDQDGHAFELGSGRGAPVLVSMFYSSCEMVCPVLFETIAQTLKQLPAASREAVRIVMVSFDPERDTVAILKQTADKHGCDPRWSLVRGSAADARQVAAALGVQYRRLPSGEFNHSSSVILLDREGRIVQRSGSLGSVDAALVAALRRAA